MVEPFVHIENLCVHYDRKPVLNNLSWVYERGNHWVIAGKSGTGKTTLVRAIAGQIKSSGNINVNIDKDKFLQQKPLYVSNWYTFTNLEGDRNFYYQQRYNRHQGQDTLTVKTELLHYGRKENLDLENVNIYINALGFDQLINSQLIELSSGEHKKLQLVKALWSKPPLLLLDQPYTGLDRKSRAALNTCLDELVKEGVHLIIISNDEELPKSINRFAEIKDGQLIEVQEFSVIQQESPREKRTLPEFLHVKPSNHNQKMVSMENVNVRYGSKEVLKNVSWEVLSGEKWLLQGSNGSGKSTLLSLINGDHPQAYANTISLFGQSRGSGESIWDIKEKIGIISPEMHWYFDEQATVWHTIASGFYDSIGWFIDVKYQEKKQIESLLDFFELTEVKDCLLNTLPLGKQRLALLARTIIKNPELLVLDEPCQGLDKYQTQYFNDVIDELCQYGKTLIYVGHYESQLPNCLEQRIILENGEVHSIEHMTVNV